MNVNFSKILYRELQIIKYISNKSVRVFSRSVVLSQSEGPESPEIYLKRHT